MIISIRQAISKTIKRLDFLRIEPPVSDEESLLVGFRAVLARISVERMRRRIRDFTTVLGCRFPTITDVRSPYWGKSALRALASWRYRFQRYESPWELDFSKRFIKLWDPRVSGL